MIDEKPDQEPRSADSESPEEPALKFPRPLSAIRREITEEELDNPATKRLIIGELDRLEGVVGSLAEYRESFHEADKEVGVLKERLKRTVAVDIIFGTTLTVGAALVGRQMAKAKGVARVSQ